MPNDVVCIDLDEIPDEWIDDYDKYKDKILTTVLKRKTGVMFLDLNMPLAMLHALGDCWLDSFLVNDDFIVFMSAPEPIKAIDSFFKKIIPFIKRSRAGKVKRKLVLESYPPYQAVRYWIWKFFNEISFDFTEKYLEDGDKILELGCGTGGFCEILAEKYPNSQIVGFDMSKACIDFAKKHSKYKNIDYLVGEFPGILEKLKKKYGLFDAFYDNGISIFDPKARKMNYFKNSINDVYTILKPQGHCFSITTKGERKKFVEKNFERKRLKVKRFIDLHMAYGPEKMLIVVAKKLLKKRVLKKIKKRVLRKK